MCIGDVLQGPKEKIANSAKRMNFTALPSSSLSNCKGLPGMGRVGSNELERGEGGEREKNLAIQIVAHLHRRRLGFGQTHHPTFVLL